MAKPPDADDAGSVTGNKPAAVCGGASNLNDLAAVQPRDKQGGGRRGRRDASLAVEANATIRQAPFDSEGRTCLSVRVSPPQPSMAQEEWFVKGAGRGFCQRRTAGVSSRTRGGNLSGPRACGVRTRQRRRARASGGQHSGAGMVGAQGVLAEPSFEPTARSTRHDRGMSA